MFEHLISFLTHWAMLALALWLASHLFRGIVFANTPSLVLAALLLGFANTVIKPLLILLTFPLTLLTFGFFLLVINALVILLVSALVPGFKVSGFWTAFFASIFISIFSFVTGGFIVSDGPAFQPMTGGTWV